MAKYSLLIADDEPRIIELILQLGHFSELEIEVLCTCTSGTEAYGQILSLHPDIVLSDIKMPELDGIDLIKKVRTNWLPGPLFVLISGYRHFEYARSAVSLNVMDYLLKPIEEEQLNDTLHRATMEIDRQRLEKDDRQKVSSMEQKEAQKRMEGFWKLCMGEAEEETLRTLAAESICNRIYGTEFQTGCYQVLYLCSDLNAVLGQADSNDRISRYSRESFSGLAGISIRTDYKGTILVLNFPVEKQKEIRDAITAFYYRIRELGERYGQFGLNIGVSGLAFSVSALPELFRSARAAQWARLVLSRNGVVDHYQISNLPGFSWTRLFDSSEEKVIRDAVRYLRKEELAEIFGEIYHRSEPLSHFYPGDMADSFGRLEQILGETLEEGEEKQVFFENYYYAYLNGKTFPGVIRNIYLVLEAHLDEELRKLKEKKGKPTAMAVAYMRQNYEKQLSLDEVATAANVSGKYLSRIFPEEMGMGFHDFLTEIRLEESEKLLSETNLSVKEIAAMVGYLDEKYYSKLFKKQKGIKPTEYRRIYS